MATLPDMYIGAESMKRVTLNITVKTTRRFRVRIALAMWLMRLAGHVLGVGNITITRVDE